MDWKSYFRALEIAYRIEINQELQNTIKEHFGENLKIYTDQDLSEQTRKIIQEYSYRHQRKSRFDI